MLKRWGRVRQLLQTWRKTERIMGSHYNHLRSAVTAEEAREADRKTILLQINDLFSCFTSDLCESLFRAEFVAQSVRHVSHLLRLNKDAPDPPASSVLSIKSTLSESRSGLIQTANTWGPCLSGHWRWSSFTSAQIKLCLIFSATMGYKVYRLEYLLSTTDLYLLFHWFI